VNSNNIGRVVFWMTGALLSFSIMAVSIRGLGPVLNPFEMLALRNGSGVLMLCALIAVRPALRLDINLQRIRLHLLRNVVHFAAQVGWVQSILLLPLATVFALEFTTPIWVALLAVVALGERMTLNRAATVLLGFAGVLVIMRPGLESFQPAALLMLAVAAGFAVNAVVIKKLTATQTTFAILFWMNLIQLPLNLLGSDPFFLGKLGAAQVLPALGFAVAGLTSHYCFTNAFRSGDALVVVPLDFLRIPLIATVGWLLFGEALDPLVFAGAGLIIAGILWNLLVEARRQRAAAAE
jgi:drug/metabolite transporter (DMT)-like permease